MDKETLSNYGWIVICVLVLAVMIALATPFGTYIKSGVENTTAGLFDTQESALNVVGMTAGDGSFNNGGSTSTELTTLTAKTWNGLTSFYGSCVWTDDTNIYYSNGSKQYVLDAATSTWSEKTWKGLTRLSGDHIWTDGENYYCSNSSSSYGTVGNYILNVATSTWEEMIWNGDLTSFDGYSVWTDGTNYYYSYGSNQYILQ